MDEKTDALRDLYMDIASEETLTEHQREEPSKAPVEAEAAAVDEAVEDVARQDGLEEAVEGVETAESVPTP